MSDISLKQMSLFENVKNEIVKNKIKKTIYYLYIDGASRGNPGNAGAGCYLKSNISDVFKKCFFLGKCTNNVAEYSALLLGIFFAKNFLTKDDNLIVRSDSKLLICQMDGSYKVKNEVLKKMYIMAKSELLGLSCSFEHIYREYNVVADLLANEGIDKKVQLPLKFLELVYKYEISL